MNKKSKKKLIITIFVILALFILIGGICLIVLAVEKHTDVSGKTHAIVIVNNTEFKSSFCTKKYLKPGENVYILEEQEKNDQKYYKVKYKNRVGTIYAGHVNYFKQDEKSEYVLMSDVSKFNKNTNFDKTEDYEFFLINHKINYAYIRLGGRGYGKEGNFYTDPETKMFVDACEYLGIPYGFYYLDEALNSDEIDEEVEFVKGLLEENQTSMCKLPLAIDIEYQDGKGRADNIWDERANLLEELIKDFKSEGINTIVYANYKKANEYLTELDANFWVAYYPVNDEIPDEWYFDNEESEISSEEFKGKIIGWQFSESGAKKDQIKENIDLSIVKNLFFLNIIKR